ncbi:MAG: FlgO family outer membrane protein [Syntrophaceae bacterium]|nr:FlgO family outer membrane protein [Syntrophaceae bacterium]
MEREKCYGAVLFSVLLAVFCATQATMAQSELTAKVEELADKLTSSISGEVAGVEGEIIYVDLGEKDSVNEGAQFEVVRLGEIVMVGNKTIHKERPVGEIEITKVRKDMSLAKATTSFAQIQKGDKVYQKRKKVKRITLIEFPYRDVCNDLTKNIYESLSTHLVQKGLVTVERSQLDRVLAEQRISHSGMIDISTAQKLGQLLGTEAIILGSATDMGNNVAIRARLVDVGKGLVLNAAEVGITKTPEIMAMLETERPSDAEGTSRPPSKSNVPVLPGPVKKASSVFENDFLRIEAVSLSREARGMVLKLKHINKTNNPYRAGISRNDTYVVDDIGTQYTYLGTVEDRIYWDMELPPRAPRIVSLVFDRAQSGAREFTFSAKYYFIQGQGGKSQNEYISLKRLRLD